MPPKFESSFIPKGPIGSTAAPLTARKSERTLLGFLATLIFIISVLAAAGALGYKFYLNYSVKNMKTELAARRAELETETLSEITRLNNRLIAASELTDSHHVLTPVFSFFDIATVRQVRLTEFSYNTLEGEPKLIIKGEAKGYAALALQAELMKKSELFQNPVFRDLHLDEKGNVEFSFEAGVDQGLLSYRREVEKMTAPAAAAPLAPAAATSTATTTKATATSTSTSTPRR